ncbi:MAG: hypothetical protein AABY86_03235, partial [Bdellovibrionota bacterium]
MKKFVVLSLVLVASLRCWAENIQDVPSLETFLWNAMKETGHYMYAGAGLQFTQQTNLYWAGIATPSLWYSFHEDKRISRHYMRGDV